MESLNLKEAADFLKIHPVTLSIKASAGEIQGAKIGKRWVFLKVDLIAYLRAQYKVRALQGERNHYVTLQAQRFAILVGQNQYWWTTTNTM